MPSVRQLIKYGLALAAVANAAPASKRQDPAPEPAPEAPEAPPAAGGITDIDILQFALTAEHLESAFYAQGFERFPDDDFRALGLSDATIESLKQVGKTEATHVSFLLGAIAQAGFKPVQACEYNFNFDTAANMVATARTLEAIGVSAYLGAAPLITDPAILGAAASIATIESRHQSFIRVAQAAEPIPAAFDTPLGPRAVFTLAAPFITSCPDGSLLNIESFPSIQLDNAAGALPGARVNLIDQAQPEGAAFCAYLTVGGQRFSPLENGSCEIPHDLAGESYLMITSEKSIADEAILAGPTVLTPS